MSGGNSDRESGAYASVWVRHCADCNRDDLDAAFGRPDIIQGAWVCRACGGRRWTAVRRDLPLGTPPERCPYRSEGR